MAWKHNKKRGGKVVIGSQTYTIDAQGFIHRAGDYTVAPETATICVDHPNYRPAEHPSELEAKAKEKAAAEKAAAEKAAAEKAAAEKAAAEKAAAEKAAAEKNDGDDDSKDEEPEPKGKKGKSSKKGKGK